MRLQKTTDLQVGLIGYDDIPTGLGQLAARFWRCLPFDGRLVVRHGRFPSGPWSALGQPKVEMAQRSKLQWWMDQFDIVVFCERPYLDEVTRIGRARDVKTVCVPMPEWLPPGLPWLSEVDSYLALTDQCLSHCNRIGLGDRTQRIQCPLDLDEFPFRQRTKVERVGYLDGTGGVHERKGRPVVERMLKKHPGSVEIKSLRGSKGTERSAQLYEDLDLVLVPGRFDGLGLTLLEAMASGCLVIATDCAPYNEFINAAFPVLGQHLLVEPRSGSMVGIWQHKWPAADVHEDDLWECVERVKGFDSADVMHLSDFGRYYIEQYHNNWAQLWEAICQTRT